MAGVTSEVASQQATDATALHKLTKASPNEEHNLSQYKASIPEGPAAPRVEKAARLITHQSSSSKITGSSRLESSRESRVATLP